MIDSRVQPAFLILPRDDGPGQCLALSCQRVFAPQRIPGVFARSENLLARQGPSQHPRECEKCGLD
jgi:hypothetical protein